MFRSEQVYFGGCLQCKLCLNKILVRAVGPGAGDPGSYENSLKYSSFVGTRDYHFGSSATLR